MNDEYRIGSNLKGSSPGVIEALPRQAFAYRD
jgi:hypothetical protein